MQVKRFKSVAFMAVLLFLLGVGVAGAADREERQFAKQPRERKGLVHSGKHQGGLEYFLKSLGSSECSSSCCWATANCDGAGTRCTSTQCDAWCADGTSSTTVCDANAT
jgi:hypothetical protein